MTTRTSPRTPWAHGTRCPSRGSKAARVCDHARPKPVPGAIRDDDLMLRIGPIPSDHDDPGLTPQFPSQMVQTASPPGGLPLWIPKAAIPRPTRLSAVPRREAQGIRKGDAFRSDRIARRTKPFPERFQTDQSLGCQRLGNGSSGHSRGPASQDRKNLSTTETNQ